MYQTVNIFTFDFNIFFADQVILIIGNEIFQIFNHFLFGKIKNKVINQTL